MTGWKQSATQVREQMFLTVFLTNKQRLEQWLQKSAKQTSPQNEKSYTVQCRYPRSSVTISSLDLQASVTELFPVFMSPPAEQGRTGNR